MSPRLRVSPRISRDVGALSDRAGTMSSRWSSGLSQGSPTRRRDGRLGDAGYQGLDLALKSPLPVGAAEILAKGARISAPAQPQHNGWKRANDQPSSKIYS